MGNIKFRPGHLVTDAIDYMTKRLNNKELTGDYLNKKRCIHLACDDDGEAILHVQKNSEGALVCEMCNRKIYNRFDQSAIDIFDRCERVILSRQQLTLDFANLSYSTELIRRNGHYSKYIKVEYLPIHINEIYQARSITEHAFAKARQLLKELVTYVMTYKNDHGPSINDETLKHLYPPINDETENPEHISSDITPISGNDVTLIDECISVIDQLLIFGILNGLRDYAQNDLLIFRSALHNLVEDLENSDDMNK